MHKTLIILACLLTVWLASCKIAPNPCFVVLTPADSIRVGYAVRFDASCTSDASKYYWDFGNGQTSTAIVTQVKYDTTGSYKVALTVGSTGKSGSTTKTIVVNP